ncbi:MAG: rhodanese-like domain-containing protein [Anaerolineae bacterium]|nr:rhodanese-like domain-containing protein [Anaerolineae bacterium]
MFRNLFSSTRSSIAQISPAELKQRLQNKDSLVMVDVRSPEEYAHDGHISGVRLMPLPVIPVRSQELPKDKPIVCVCRSGARSQVACETLQRQGFTQVMNLSGGMIAWQRAVESNEGGRRDHRLTPSQTRLLS